MNIIISQFLGIIAFIIFIFSLQNREKKKILFWQMISFLFYSVQYLIIKAYSGMIVFIINGIKSFIFYKKEKSGVKDKKILIIFIFITFILGVFLYNELYDILPIIATVLSIIFTWQQSTKILRIGQVIASILWIVYDINVKAYVGIITEIIISITSIFALLYNDYNINILKKYA